ncbi:calcium-binding protein [Zavarzinia aquatilis]|uniref:calcium-binding protein n=1 Tax=Zavarzinia aquatilis TaxID=2211142 RepID=UPI00105780C2|nr:calcium-binding protein [Zavarzinia aquatilis]
MLDANGNKIALFTDPAAAAQVLQSYLNGDSRLADAGFGGGLHPSGSHQGYNGFIREQISAIIDDASLGKTQKQNALWNLHEFATRVSMGTMTYKGNLMPISGKLDYAATLKEAYALFKDGNYNGHNDPLKVFVPSFEQGGHQSNFDATLTDAGSGSNSEARLDAIESLVETTHAAGDLPEAKYNKYAADIAEVRGLIADGQRDSLDVRQKVAALGRAATYDAGKHGDVFPNHIDYDSTRVALENAVAQHALDTPLPNHLDPDRTMDALVENISRMERYDGDLPQHLGDFSPQVRADIHAGFNHILTGVGGGFIGDVGEFLNVSYDSLKKGINTGDWSDFRQNVINYGASAVLSAGLAFSSIALAGAVAGPIGAAAMSAFWAAYGVYDAITNLAELGDKILTDMANGEFGSFWQGLANIFYSPVISPLVLDMDGDGLDLIAFDDSSAHFDLDEDGRAEATAWIGADDAFLAHDVDGDGKIDDLSELFGGQDEDGFAALAVHDGNADGVIDAKDAIFADLVLWRDQDGDGVTDAGELTSLASAGVTSIDLGAAFVDRWVGGNWISHEGTYQGAGGSGAIYDVWFENDQTNAIDPDEDETPPPADVAVLPNLVGYGDLSSFQTAMAADESLRADVEAFVRNAHDGDYQVMADTVEQFLLRWAGVEDVPSDGRGPYVDGRHLAFLEKVHGVPFVAYGGASDPRWNAGNALESYYAAIVGSMTARFMAQVNVAAYQLWVEDGETGSFEPPATAFMWLVYDHATDSLFGDFEAVIRHIVIDGATPYYADEDYGPASLGIDDITDIAAIAAMLQTDFAARSDEALAQVAIRIMGDYGVSQAVTDVFEAVYQGVPVTAGTPGNDHLTGTSGKDVMAGGAGDDELQGGAGDDIYLYTRGDGHDTVSDSSYSNGADTLVLQGVTSHQISLSREDGDNVTLQIPASSTEANDAGSIFLSLSLDWDYGYGVDRIAFDDDVVWSKADLRRELLDRTSTGGDDTIRGFGTDDEIAGGLGDDGIVGGRGSDTYYFAKGDGVDQIADGGSSSDIDTLILAHILPARVRVIEHADRMILLFSDSPGDRIYLTDQFDPDGGIERIVFDDGRVWSRANLLNRAEASDGTIVTHRGTRHDDTLDGSGIGDLIEGRAGADLLRGGTGDDIYRYMRGDGDDTIAETGEADKADVLELRGVATSAVRFTADGTDILITIAASHEGAGDGAVITLKGGLAGGSYGGIEVIRFDDGTEWSPTSFEVWLENGDLDILTALNLIVANFAQSIGTMNEKVAPAVLEVVELLVPVLTEFVVEDLSPFLVALVGEGVVPLLTGDFAALGPALAASLSAAGLVVDGIADLLLPATGDVLSILLPVLSDFLLNDVVPAINQKFIVDGLVPALTGDFENLDILLSEALTFAVPTLTGAVDTLVGPVTEVLVDDVLPTIGALLRDGVSPILTGAAQDDAGAWFDTLRADIFAGLGAIADGTGGHLAPAIARILADALPATADFVATTLPVVGDILAHDVAPALTMDAELPEAVADDIFDFVLPPVSAAIVGVTDVATDLLAGNVLPIVSDILVDGLAPALTGDIGALAGAAGSAVGGLLADVGEVVTSDVPGLFGWLGASAMKDKGLAAVGQDHFHIF